MKVFFCLSLLFCSVSLAKDGLPDFPQNYDSNSNLQNNQSSEGFINEGRLGDDFVQESPDTRKRIEPGNTSYLVKCPDGGTSCHVKLPATRIDDNTQQFRFIPTDESGAQTNPYAEIVNRQRIMAPVKQEQAEEVPSIKEKDVPNKQLKRKSDNFAITFFGKKIRPYGFLFGGKMSGNMNFTSKENTPENIERINFIGTKNYGASQSINLGIGGGFEVEIPFWSSLRLESAVSFYKLEGNSYSISNFKNIAVNNNANSNFSDEVNGNFGNAKIMSATFSLNIDVMKRMFGPLYPSIGAFIGTARVAMSQNTQVSPITTGIYGYQAHINYDINNDTTLYFGVKRTKFMHKSNMSTSSNYQDAKYSNTQIYNDRITNSSILEISRFNITSFEIGFRIY